MPLRHADGRYRFDEEKAAESPLYVQRLLTELGRRVEMFTSGVENDARKLGHYKHYPRKKVELFEDRMERLTGAARLCVRNGFDLAGILHLIDHRKFNGIIRLPDADLQDFILSKADLSQKKKDQLLFEIVAAGDSDSQEEGYVLGLPELDRYGPEGMREAPHAPEPPKSLGKRKAGGESSVKKKKKSRKGGLELYASSSSEGDVAGALGFEPGGNQPVRDDDASEPGGDYGDDPGSD